MLTFAHGLLSGIGHPLLGFDHLFFVALAGVAAVLTGFRFIAPMAYIVAMLAGCLVTALWTSLPATELVIALSLLILGGMLLSGRAFSLHTVLLAFAAFGLFHGSAFGESLASQEAGFAPQVLVGYLVGLGAVQYAVALVTGQVCTSLYQGIQASAVQPRLAGAMVAGAGLYLTLEHLEGPLLQAIMG